MKVVTSPVKRWPGTVTLYDPLPFPQVIAWEKAAGAVMAAADDATSLTEADYLLLPGLLACVESWQLERFPAVVTVETFPASPRQSSYKLFRWLVGEIAAVYKGDGEDEDPK